MAFTSGMRSSTSGGALTSGATGSLTTRFSSTPTFKLPSVQSTFNQFSSLFPPPPSALTQVQQQVRSLPALPTIRPPVIPATQVAFPQGSVDQLRSSLFESQFQPVERALRLRGAEEQRQLGAQVSQAGLADSGAGVGIQARQAREQGEQLGAAASQISESATAASLQAQLAVAQQQANITIQENLARSQLSFNAQTQNAANILQRGQFEGNALLAALGLDRQTTQNMQQNFTAFLSSRMQAALQQSQLAATAASQMFNLLLQKQAAAQQAAVSPETQLAASRQLIELQQGLAGQTGRGLEFAARFAEPLRITQQLARGERLP